MQIPLAPVRAISAHRNLDDDTRKSVDSRPDAANVSQAQRSVTKRSRQQPQSILPQDTPSLICCSFSSLSLFIALVSWLGKVSAAAELKTLCLHLFVVPSPPALAAAHSYQQILLLEHFLQLTLEAAAAAADTQTHAYHTTSCASSPLSMPAKAVDHCCCNKKKSLPL